MVTGAPTLTYAEARALFPRCEEFRSIVRSLGGREKWHKTPVDAATAAAAGIPLGYIMEACTRRAKTNADVKRRMRLWAADCAAHVLPVYEKRSPSNAPRNAITEGRRFARGEIHWSELSDVIATADDVWAVPAPALPDRAARASARAAAMLLWDDIRGVYDTARDAAEDDARVAARSGDWAHWATHPDAAWAARAAGSSARFAEEQWQLDRLVQWMSADEPEDWPLPPQTDVSKG